MNVSEIIKNSVNYSLSDFPKLLILGVILVIGALYVLFNTSSVLYYILAIVSVIVALVVSGYTLSIMRESINGSSEIPSISFESNVIDALKVLVVQIVYAVIIFVISFIILLITTAIGVASGSYDQVMVLVSNVTSSATVNAIVQNPAMLVSLGIFITLILIVAIIFGLLSTISLCRLANTGSIGEALSFGKLFGDIGRIGWGKYIGLYILVIIVCFIVAMIIGLLGIVPIIGPIIAIFICVPFTLIFGARAFGLLYANNL